MITKKQSGLSLIELMIAILISSLLLLATINLFSSNKRTYNEQHSLARMQENARFALNLMTYDIRMIGHIGCHNDHTKVTNNINITTLENNKPAGVGVANALHSLYSFDADHLIEAYDGNSLWGGAVIAARAPTNQTNNIVNNSGITIRYIQPLSNDFKNVTGKMTSASDPVLIDTSALNNFNVGDVAAIYDCISTDIFVVTGTTGGLQHDGGATNVNLTGSLSKSYNNDAIIGRVVSQRYYVGTIPAPSTTPFGLYRATAISNTPELIIPGVFWLGIIYGQDNNNDDVPDIYSNAFNTNDQITNWQEVIAVKIELGMQSEQELIDIDPDTQIYPSIFGTDIDPPDERRRRKLFSTTVKIRNR